jgi:predicted RNase H-like HicB family nuclease
MHNLALNRGSFQVASRAYRRSGTDGAPRNRFFSIKISKQPEGIWLATSDDILGLFVEGDTVEEARGEALIWARELLAENLGIAGGPGTVFVIDDGRGRVYERA